MTTETWRVLLFLAATGVLYDALVMDKKTGPLLTLLPCHTLPRPAKPGPSTPRRSTPYLRTLYHETYSQATRSKQQKWTMTR